MKIRLFALTAATLALSVACVDGYDYAELDSAHFDSLGPRLVTEGAVRADLPGFVTTDGQGMIESFDEPGFRQVTVTRNEGNRQAMGIVFLNEGDFNNPIFTDVGRTTRFSIDQPVDNVEEPISMSVVGCGGDPSSAWFDETPEEFEVTVDEGEEPGDRVVTITSEYDDGGELDTQLLLAR